MSVWFSNVSWCPTPAPVFSHLYEIPTDFPVAHDAAAPGGGADLTAQDVAFFRRSGYFTTKMSLLTPESVLALRAAVFRAYAGIIDTPCGAPYDHPQYLEVLTKASAAGFGPPTTKTAADALAAKSSAEFAATKNTAPAPLLKINNAWWISATAQRFLLSRGGVGELIGKMACDLLGVNSIRIWHDQFIVKPGLGAAAGSCGWHQDMAYWEIASSPHLITALIQLQDTDERNGCLQTIEESHRFGLLSAGEDDSKPVADPGFFQGEQFDALAVQYRARLKRARGRRSEASQQRKEEEEEEEVWKLVLNKVAAGQVTFHHCYTLHGSGSNNTDVPRVAYAIHMQADELVRYKVPAGGGTHHNARDLGPLAKPGDAFDGPAFPVLFRREQKKGMERENESRSKSKL